MINTEHVMRKVLAQGFTLVELLIVIALLGVIATIVIAAINPIEQANRAADAGMKADASQVVSALQRYYVGHGGYPWNDINCPAAGTCDNSTGSSASDKYAFIDAADAGVGVCGVASNCKSAPATKQGLLVTSLELQSAFVNKSWIDATNTSMWVGKALGSSASVFVCWAPKAQSNRQALLNSVTSGNRLFTVASAFTGTGLPQAGDPANCALGNTTHWTDGTCVECEPE